MAATAEITTGWQRVLSSDCASDPSPTLPKPPRSFATKVIIQMRDKSEARWADVRTLSMEQGIEGLAENTPARDNFARTA
jgi:hypothetical protein